MVSAVESRKAKFDRLRWAMSIALIAVGVAGNYYFADRSLLLRVLGLSVLVVVTVLIISRTVKGQMLWLQWKESVLEVKKMYWPTRKETLQTTLAVLAMVVVMGLLLWTADFILIRAVAGLTGHWGV
jgi:preprotein translocase subunit SecE